MKVHLAGNDGYHRDPIFLIEVIAFELIKQRKSLTKIGGGNSQNEILNEKDMNIYFAGGISGNLREFWQRIMKVHLAQSFSRAEVVAAINDFVSGEGRIKSAKEKLYTGELFVGDGASALSHINILESFYYLRKNEEFMSLVKHFGSFLLDSGAFTFMSGSHKGAINWDEYVEEYAAFINRHDVKLFFELDIDSVVGLTETERLRAKLEMLTGKKPIPVWHKSRGKEYFIKMCQQYPYVAVGGIVTKEIPRNIYEKAFPWFISTAHKYGAKIHGLGYTTIANLHKYHFDSVDSTAWLYGNRGGYLYKFNPRTGLMEQMSKDGCRLKSREGAVNNFNEWVKFGVYAQKFL